MFTNVLSLFCSWRYKRYVSNLMVLTNHADGQGYCCKVHCSMEKFRFYKARLYSCAVLHKNVYLNTSTFLRATYPQRKSQSGILSLPDEYQNESISSAWILVKNCGGRLQSIWVSMSQSSVKPWSVWHIFLDRAWRHQSPKFIKLSTSRRFQQFCSNTDLHVFNRFKQF